MPKFSGRKAQEVKKRKKKFRLWENSNPLGAIVSLPWTGAKKKKVSTGCAWLSSVSLGGDLLSANKSYELRLVSMGMGLFRVPSARGARDCKNCPG